jgi:hypothetical protein
MPIEYTIDISRRFILTTASGEVTTPEVMNHQNRLMRDPFFDPTFSQLVDFGSVTRVAIPLEDLRLLATRNFFGPRAKRCLVGPTSEMFGMARMFQIFREVNGAPEQIRVFRDREEALLWLFGDDESSG